MPEQLREVADRFVWGTPNVDDVGRLIGPSNCRACVHWRLSGRLPGRIESEPACTLHHRDFPYMKDCRDYAREPGSDDD